MPLTVAIRRTLRAGRQAGAQRFVLGPQHGQALVVDERPRRDEDRIPRILEHHGERFVPRVVPALRVAAPS